MSLGINNEEINYENEEIFCLKDFITSFQKNEFKDIHDILYELLGNFLSIENLSPVVFSLILYLDESKQKINSNELTEVALKIRGIIETEIGQEKKNYLEITKKIRLFILNNCQILSNIQKIALCQIERYFMKIYLTKLVLEY